jgi:hypothetical protein
MSEDLRRFFAATDSAIDAAVGSEKDLGEQSAEELDASLQKLNAVIETPELVSIDWSILGSFADSVVPDKKAFDEDVIIPKLLDRKSFILRRIAIVDSQDQVEKIKDAAAANIQDSADRMSMIKSIDTITKESMTRIKTLEQQADTIAEKREAWILDYDIMEKKVRLKERRSRLYRSWVERESVASIVGGILLLGLGIALVVAMFIGTTASEVVTSSFLLILGYFFGQSTARSNSPAEES